MPVVSAAVSMVRVQTERETETETDAFDSHLFGLLALTKLCLEN